MGKGCVVQALRANKGMVDARRDVDKGTHAKLMKRQFGWFTQACWQLDNGMLVPKSSKGGLAPAGLVHEVQVNGEDQLPSDRGSAAEGLAQQSATTTRVVFAQTIWTRWRSTARILRGFVDLNRNCQKW
jgi:hypothetical protein